MNSDTIIKNVLILAANPKGTSFERVSQELRDIKEGLQRAQNREQFNLEQKLAVRPLDMRRAILDFKPYPHIVHFCGRSAGREGLVLEDNNGEPKLVSGASLAGLFELFTDKIECVILNSCYSQEQAEVIAEHINYVIGMKREISDKAAIDFSIGFYDALGAGEPIERAYAIGCNSMQMEGAQEREYSAPVLLKKEDVIARKPQKQILKKLWRRIPWSGVFNVVPKSSMPITFAVICLRFFGAFEASELWLYDQMMTLKQPFYYKQNENIFIIEVTKKDIENQKGARQGSLTDETLLGIFKKLLSNNKSQPKTIGIDIYRDFKTDEKSELAKILKDESRIFAVCNVGLPGEKDGVKPPDEVPNNRLGFSDFIQDNNGQIIRRQLLFMKGDNESPCKKETVVTNSFNLQLATHYLSQNAKFKLNNKNFKIRNKEFQLIYGIYRGGYSMLSDLEGHQILLNYRSACSGEAINICSPEYIAKKFTVEQVLKENILNKYDLNNKIILIGVTDPSYEAPWSTPFYLPKYNPIPGVIIQAQMVNQILDAVSGERSFITVWSIWYEMLWIFLWSLIAGVLIQWYLFKKRFIVYGGIAFIILPISSLILFISPVQVWAPLLPPALSFIGTGGAVAFLNRKNRKS